MIGIQNKKILVTGGTGFIGSHLVNMLNSEGCDVSCIALDDSFDWRIENKKTEIDYINLLDKGKLEKYIKRIKPRIVFHLAAYVNSERSDLLGENMISSNIIGTVNLLNSLNSIDYELFVNTGTCEEYGTNNVPFLESQRENPVSPYSASKVSVTYYCQMLNKVFNKPIITVRPFLTYGGKQLSRMLIPWLIYSGMNNVQINLTKGEQRKDFIYVTDVVRAYIALAEKSDIVGNENIFNIGTGNDVKVKEIVGLISSKFEKTYFNLGAIDYRVGEKFRFFPSIEKIITMTGWNPIYTLEQGIEETLLWWKRNKNIWVKYKHIWE